VQQHQTTAVLVTHDLSEAVTLVDELLVLSARPARLVYRWRNERSPQVRDPAYVYRTLSALQNIPEIAASFGLENPFPTSQEVRPHDR